VKKLCSLTIVIVLLGLFINTARSQPHGCSQADYDLWLSQYQQQVEPGTGADWNGDGVVDGQDYVIWLNSCDNQESVEPPPENPPPAEPPPNEPPPVNEQPLPTCSVDAFSVSPNSGNAETLFTLSGRGSCSSGVRALRFKVDGGIIYELGAPEASATWSSSGAASGNHVATIEVAGWGDNDWVAAASSSQTFSIIGSDPSLPSCSVQSLNISPASGVAGTNFEVSGSGECNTGVRAIRFKIDGNVIYELGAPSASTSWNSSGASIGSHAVTVEVAGHGDNNWAAAASQTMQFAITGEGGQTGSQPQPISNNWVVGNTVYLCQGTEIRVGSGLNYDVHTLVPVNNWDVSVVSGPRSADGAIWWDISRADGGTGWVQQNQADCLGAVTQLSGNQASGETLQSPSPDIVPLSSSILVYIGSNTPDWERSLQIISTINLSIRNGPSFGSRVIGTATPGTYFELLGEPENGWYHIRYNAGDGWVNGDWVVPYLPEQEAEDGQQRASDSSSEANQAGPQPGPRPEPIHDPEATSNLINRFSTLADCTQAAFAVVPAIIQSIASVRSGGPLIPPALASEMSVANCIVGLFPVD
jgi:hypothetical protein